METSTWFKLAGSRKLPVCGQGVQAPWLFRIPGFSAFQVGLVNEVAVTVGQSRDVIPFHPFHPCPAPGGGPGPR